ncbi:MAG TPA: Holliday junction branch migration protein RuvA [Actinomycetota bacterium]|nr:Holliday junction branch migration protein RuvA [Actinomycetota bacterium]
MISSVRGTVTELGLGAVEVEVNGVGYFVQVSSSTLRTLRLGEKVRLLTQMVVREDALSLYGFPDIEQRELFRSLTGVTGVGPKLALAVLGHMKPDALRRAIASSDVDALVEVPGVGKRSAQRMILELKSRLGIADSGYEASGSKLAEVREALIGLGYAPGELGEVLEGLSHEGDKIEDMVKAALKALSKV